MKKPKPCAFCGTIVKNSNKDRVAMQEYGGVRGSESKVWCNNICWKLYWKKENKERNRKRFEEEKEEIAKAI